jgi:DNA processing protein
MTITIRLFDAEYPVALRGLGRPPVELWVRGTIPRERGLAIVGTRQPSPGARDYAFRLGRELAAAGWVIWSGGAAGIDESAHEGALDAGGSTVLVAGGGLDRPYPPQAAGLFRRVEGRGALISLVPDEAPPQRWAFLARNGVLAALTEATVVVECPLKSGARSAAAAARKLGKPVWIGAQAPWSPFIEAVREEVRLGAKLLLGVGDILGALGTPRPVAAAKDAGRLPGLRGEVQQRVARGDRSLDQLCEAMGKTAAELRWELGMMLLEGQLVEGDDGGYQLPPHHVAKLHKPLSCWAGGATCVGPKPGLVRGDGAHDEQRSRVSQDTANPRGRRVAHEGEDDEEVPGSWLRGSCLERPRQGFAQEARGRCRA